MKRFFLLILVTYIININNFVAGAEVETKQAKSDLLLLTLGGNKTTINNFYSHTLLGEIRFLISNFQSKNIATYISTEDTKADVLVTTESQSYYSENKYFFYKKENYQNYALLLYENNRLRNSDPLSTNMDEEVVALGLGLKYYYFYADVAMGYLKSHTFNLAQFLKNEDNIVKVTAGVNYKTFYNVELEGRSSFTFSSNVRIEDYLVKLTKSLDDNFGVGFSFQETKNYFFENKELNIVKRVFIWSLTYKI